MCVSLKLINQVAFSPLRSTTTRVADILKSDIYLMAYESSSTRRRLRCGYQQCFHGESEQSCLEKIPVSKSVLAAELFCVSSTGLPTSDLLLADRQLLHHCVIIITVIKIFHDWTHSDFQFRVPLVWTISHMEGRGDSFHERLHIPPRIGRTFHLVCHLFGSQKERTSLHHRTSTICNQ